VSKDIADGKLVKKCQKDIADGKFVKKCQRIQQIKQNQTSRHAVGADFFSFNIRKDDYTQKNS
jgi:hypothetical protein